jgi:hypothetical protein
MRTMRQWVLTAAALTAFGFSALTPTPADAQRGFRGVGFRGGWGRGIGWRGGWGYRRWGWGAAALGFGLGYGLTSYYPYGYYSPAYYPAYGYGCGRYYFGYGCAAY